MKFRNLIFLLIFFNVTLFAQQTYFIKYKDTVPESEIAGKVQTQTISKSFAAAKVNGLNPEVRYFAKGQAEDISDLRNILKVTFPDETDDSAVESLLNSDPSIEYIQKNTIYRIETAPNDSAYADQWALHRIGAAEAWNYTAGSDTVLAGVIDTGIDYLHPDITNKIYKNPGETGLDASGRDKSSNGIDDDGNGFIDDYMGWDFVDRVGFPFDTTDRDYLNWDNDPMDQHFHGTYVAGILAAETNNGIGIAGAAPNIKVLNLRAFDPTGNGEEDDVAAAIIYAVKMGVKVINMSFGDYSFSYVLRDVIKYAHSRGVVLVASSGNNGRDEPHYPSGYSEVISVGNSTDGDFVAGSSSFGSTLDLTAPGTAILSLNIGGSYRVDGGTSASAPFVSAAAALILSRQNYTNEEVKQILKSTADDISTPGWDLKSGAGRLNMLKAVSASAPAKIKFNFPLQDYGSSGSSLTVNASVLSPYFVSYDLLIGAGLNPSEFTELVSGAKNQILNEDIFTLDLSGYADSAYTLALRVYLSNGSVTEERVNFHRITKPAEAELAGLGSAYYGAASTIVGEIYTSQRAAAKMYYRIKGEAEFKYITLDGFNTNNSFVKQFHYGFLPKHLTEPNSIYEVYFEAVNMAGIVTKITEDNGSYFEIYTDDFEHSAEYSKMDFSLPKGDLYKKPVNFLSGAQNEVLLQEFYPSTDVYYSLYSLNTNNFQKYTADSVKNKAPMEVLDMNGNGKNELISYAHPKGFIDEQKEAGIFSFNNAVTDSSGRFFPVYAGDLHGSGFASIISNVSNSKYLVYRINPDLSVTLYDSLLNYTYYGENMLNNNVIVTDFNGDGTNEVWFVDSDGDLISYSITSGSFTQGDTISNPDYFGSPHSNSFSAGDFDGDGKPDLAVLLSSNGIAPLFWLNVYSYRNNKPEIIFQKVFIDQSYEFIGFTFSKAYQSLNMADLDNDGRQEIILNIFPYLYVFKKDTHDKLIFFKEGVNSKSIFTGDLNNNGIVEIGIQETAGNIFYEFGSPNKTSSPVNLKGYSLADLSIKLEWEGEGNRFYIYKGLQPGNLTLYDSTAAASYQDMPAPDTTMIYYSVQAFNPSKPEPLSGLSNIAEVYSHRPAKAVSVQSTGISSLLVEFNNKVKTTIDNLNAFELNDGIFPVSISPASQFSYLLNFKEIPAGSNSLYIEKLTDFYGSPVDVDSLMFIHTPVNPEQEFFISSHQILDRFNIKVTFNLPVDEVSFTELNSYSFEPDNAASAVSFDPEDNRTVYIALDKKRPIGSIGREYRLHIKDVYSSTASGSIKISSGAGSYVTLTGFAMDLSDVYVYPSPVNVSAAGKLTFANLPKRAGITIFSLSGEKIFELTETDGDGGIDYDLKNYNGERIPSGIYIYRVVMLDDMNNESDEKLGKFAVIN